MVKKIPWIVAGLLLVGAMLYLKLYYPDSQLQLKRLFKFVEAMPVEHFYNAPEKSCGIWHEREPKDGAVVAGRSNVKVEKCFQKAFASCVVKNIFLVKDASETDKNLFSYSLIRILKRNDQNECIIQNYHEEQKVNLGEEMIPLNYINTCTVLKDGLWNSCEPLYVKSWREEINSK
ncbi:hypothetical protein HZB94_00455 [Candidatus Falkowbacteria bacterium]|nr:hypothetical protein [Candidatus Falkowbacteria bacterium]